MPPPKPIFERLTRNILATKPRVTRFKINWDDSCTSTNGDMNIDEASNSVELQERNQPTMEENVNNGENMNGTEDEIGMDARLNENSNSLAMEC